MQIKKLFRSNLNVLLGLATVLAFSGGASLINGIVAPQQAEALSSTPFATYVTNGQVNAITKLGNTLYFGGNFSEVRTHTGYGVIVDQSTGALAFTPKIDGPVSDAVSDGADGWYVAGSFTNVGGQAVNGLAHILSSGNPDPAFTPNVNGTVDALAFDGSTLFFGGSFTTVNGTGRTNAAAVDTTGVLTGWNPAPNAGVSAVAIDGSTVYLGGGFANAGGSARNNIAAVDNSTGTATAWNPNADAGVNAIAVDGSTVYVGGAFANVGGSARNFIAAIDSATGTATAWNPNADGDVTTLGVEASNVYAGGAFANIGGAARGGAAALDKTTGNATAWDPNTNGGLSDLAVGSSDVFMGGSFTSMGGSTRNNAGAVSTGGALTGWDPDTNGTVSAVSLSSTQVFLGGAFTGAGAGTARNSAAAIDVTTGLLTSWNPDVNGPVNALTHDNTDIYLGGDFTSIGGSTRNYIGRVDSGAGAVQAWDPSADALVNDIQVVGNNAYVVGGFTNIGGAARNRVAALDTTTGFASGWNPDANAMVNDILVDGGTAYLGGNFVTVGGSLRFFIAAVDAVTGGVAAWNPGANNGVNTLDHDASNVYVGGNFTNIAGVGRNYIAAIDKTTGAASAWDPSGDSTVHSLATDTATGVQFAGGSFSNIGGAGRFNFAELDIATGVASPWNVMIDNNNQLPFDMLVDNSILYAGGSLGSGTDGFVTWFEKPIVEFAINASSGPESLTPAQIYVVLSGADSQDVTVNYTVTGGSATNGSDYNLANGQVVIPAGSTSAIINISVIDDTIVESAETIEITLSGPSANAILGTINPHTYTITDNDVVTPPNVIRIPGDTPAEQAINISQQRFPQGGADAGVFARDDVVVDAFAGAALTNVANATLLLTDTNTLTPASATELQRAVSRQSTVYILGQTAAVSAGVESAIQALGYNTIRLGGAERIATSVAIAEELQVINPTPTSKAFLSENRMSVDVFGESAVAGETLTDGIGDAQLLNERGAATLDANTDTFLSTHPEITSLEIVGGPVAVDPAVETYIRNTYPGITVSRVSGANRWETSENLANKYFPSPTTIVVANGEQANLPGSTLNAASGGSSSFYAALLAGDFAGTLNAPLLITKTDTLPAEIQRYITGHAPTINLAYVVGSVSQVSNAVFNLIATLI